MRNPENANNSIDPAGNSMSSGFIQRLVLIAGIVFVATKVLK